MNILDQEHVDEWSQDLGTAAEAQNSPQFTSLKALNTQMSISLDRIYWEVLASLVLSKKLRKTIFTTSPLPGPKKPSPMGRGKNPFIDFPPAAGYNSGPIKGD